MREGSYCNNLVQSSSCSWIGANSLLKSHRCLCLTHRPHASFRVCLRVVLLQTPWSHQHPLRAVLGEPLSTALQRCLLCVCKRQGGETRPAREQLCKSGGKQPPGRHLDEKEMPSPKPIDRDSTGKAGSLKRCEIPPRPAQRCYLLQGV